MCREFGQRYRPCDASVPGQARGLLAATLAQTLAGPGVSRLHEQAAVVLSELVTNAVQAGCSQVRVELIVHRSHLRIAVEDDAAGWPAVGVAAERDVHGRGMAIVSALAQSWGVEQLPAGKQVWAELTVAAGLADGLRCHLVS